MHTCTWNDFQAAESKTPTAWKASTLTTISPPGPHIVILFLQFFIPLRSWACVCVCLSVFQAARAETQTLVTHVGSGFLYTELNCCTMGLSLFFVLL